MYLLSSLLSRLKRRKFRLSKRIELRSEISRSLPQRKFTCPKFLRLLIIHHHSKNNNPLRSKSSPNKRRRNRKRRRKRRTVTRLAR